MTRARRELVDIDTTPYYHCICRCVRRAFLCGEDAFTGKSYEHRKGWVLERLRFLQSVFAVDLCAYAVMSNHYHLVVRLNRAQASGWSEDEVMARWERRKKLGVLFFMLFFPFFLSSLFFPGPSGAFDVLGEPSGSLKNTNGACPLE